MGLWESSQDPGSTPATTPNVDKYPEETMPATGTQTPVTNLSPDRSVNTRIVMKDAKLLWIRDNGTIVATFSIVPDVDPTTPVLIIAKTGKDVYTDVLGISRPSF